jgi:hypothetical protein
VTAVHDTAAAAHAAAIALAGALPAVATIKIDSATLFARASIRASWAVTGCALAVRYQIRGF